MMAFAVAPVLFAYLCWHRRLTALRVVDSNIDLLQRLKQLCRSSVAIPNANSESAITRVISESVDMGLRCSASLAQSVVWLRLFKLQSLKGHKLASIWLVRLLAVVGLSMMIRFYLLDSNLSSAVFGLSTSDRYLMLMSGLIAIVGTVLFLKLIPDVEVYLGSEVYGLSDWLRDRIFVESGYPIASTNLKVVAFEATEGKTGLSFSGEKIDIMDDVWRQRIFSLEKRTEAASELMPFLELVFFGLFILCTLLEPSLKYSTQ